MRRVGSLVGVVADETAVAITVVSNHPLNIQTLMFEKHCRHLLRQQKRLPHRRQSIIRHRLATLSDVADKRPRLAIIT